MGSGNGTTLRMVPVAFYPTVLIVFIANTWGRPLYRFLESLDTSVAVR